MEANHRAASKNGGDAEAASQVALLVTPALCKLCRIDIRDVDFAHGNSNVADAKTAAGVRKVDLSPMLCDELLAWRASLDAPAPESPFFPTRAGSRRDKDNINARVVRPAVRRANEPQGAPRPAAAACEGDGDKPD